MLLWRTNPSGNSEPYSGRQVKYPEIFVLFQFGASLTYFDESPQYQILQ